MRKQLCCQLYILKGNCFFVSFTDLLLRVTYHLLILFKNFALLKKLPVGKMKEYEIKGGNCLKKSSCKIR